jgi:hypothetical protein
MGFFDRKSKDSSRPESLEATSPGMLQSSEKLDEANIRTHFDQYRPLFGRILHSSGQHHHRNRHSENHRSLQGN